MQLPWLKSLKKASSWMVLSRLTTWMRAKSASQRLDKGTPFLLRDIAKFMATLDVQESALMFRTRSSRHLTLRISLGSL